MITTATAVRIVIADSTAPANSCARLTYLATCAAPERPVDRKAHRRWWGWWTVVRYEDGGERRFWMPRLPHAQLGKRSRRQFHRIKPQRPRCRNGRRAT